MVKRDTKKKYNEMMYFQQRDYLRRAEEAEQEWGERTDVPA